MKVTVNKYVSHVDSVPDMGRYMTLVTFREPFPLAMSLPGHLTRKQALGVAYDELLREGRTGTDFLQQLKAMIRNPLR